jgi:hypothetical protein
VATKSFSVRLRQFVRRSKDAFTAETTVAVLALLLTVFSAAATHKHDRLSVLPKLSFYWNTGSDEIIGLFVENSGAGPAVIRDVRRPANENVLFDQAIATGILSARPEGQTFLPTYFLQNGGPRVGLVTIASDKVKDFDAFRKLIEEQLTIFVDYCSIYGDCWTECSRRSDPTCGLRRSPAEDVFTAGFWSKIL